MSVVALWPKLLTALLMYLLYSSVRQQKDATGIRYIGYVLGTLIIRDVLVVIVQAEALIPLSDLIVLSMYIAWMRSCTGKNPIDYIFMGLNAAIVLIGLANLIVPFIPQGVTILSLIVLAEVVYLSVMLSIVSPYSLESVEIILRTRFVIIAGFVMYSIITVVYHYSANLIHMALLPGLYLVHGYLLFSYNGLLYLENTKSVQFYANSLNTTFTFMQDLGNAISAKTDLSRIMELIITSAVRHIGADAGAILMVDEQNDTLRVQATFGVYPPPYPVPRIVLVKTGGLKSYFSETPIKIGETILGEVVKEGKPVFIRDARQDERLANNMQDDALFVSSFIAIPLVVGTRVLGVLSVLKRSENQYFVEQDFHHMKTFADYASMTIDNLFTYMEVLEKRQMERDVEIAADIQQKLLPGGIPRLKTASLAVYSLPAKGVSGDYYDIVPLDEDKLALIVCDVAGKGVPAAMVMVMIRSITHLLISPQRDAASMLTGINRGVAGRIDLDRYATIGFIIYNEKTREILYANAAHVPVMVYRKRMGKLLKVDTKGLPIGVEKDTRYEQRKFQMEEGDLLFLCTDGILEAMNTKGEQYSLSSLKAIVENHPDLPADEMVKTIKDDIDRFVGTARQHDDQTLLVMRFN